MSYIVVILFFVTIVHIVWYSGLQPLVGDYVNEEYKKIKEKLKNLSNVDTNNQQIIYEMGEVLAGVVSEKKYDYKKYAFVYGLSDKRIGQDLVRQAKIYNDTILKASDEIKSVNEEIKMLTFASMWSKHGIYLLFSMPIILIAVCINEALREVLSSQIKNTYRSLFPVKKIRPIS